MRKEKLLIIDDEEHIRFLDSEELIEAGYEVKAIPEGGATTEKEVMETIRTYIPRLVVLDIRMPNLDGFDLLEKIRSKYPDLPVIISTAYETFKEDMRVIMADYFVVKSFDLTELKQKIALLLNK